MSNMKIILGDMSVQEFEVKCNALFEIGSIEGDLSTEQEHILTDFYAMWLPNGGHEVTEKLLENVPDRRNMTDEENHKFGDATYRELVKWVKEII